ncbi:MAG TPA: ABC transporter permease subunit [Anaeromyxobacteraceae bacterium]|nr:ABC transporter permease subunit [Anaeromyxobacteraceae bacterium]
MSLRLLRVALGKELLDALRDRRAVLMAVLFPLLGPLALAMTLALLERQVGLADDRPLTLAVEGAERAPRLVAFLAGAGAVVVPAPADPVAAVRSGERDVVLRIGPDYAERLAAGRPAPVELVHDASRQASHAPAARARRLLEAWGRQIGVQRLLARGVHPSLAEAVAVLDVDVSTAQSRAALVLGMLPYFVVLALFVGGMSIAVDGTAGERERQALEPLLVYPVPRWCLAAAKIGATALFAAAALAETLVGFGLVPLLVTGDRAGLPLRLEPGVLLAVFATALPLLVFVSALQVAVASRARTFKAAQGALSLLMLVPVLPGMALSFLPLALRPWMAVVPTLSEQLVIARLLRGEAAPAAFAAGAAAATGAWAAAAVAVTFRLFRSERLVF